MSSTPFEGSINISVDEAQAKILVKILSGGMLNYPEWGKLDGLKEEIEEQLNGKPAESKFNVNSALFNNRSKF